MISYTYKVVNLLRDAQGIVVTANFTITADDGVDWYTHPFTVGLNPPTGSIILFEELTEGQVIAWVKSIGQAEFEEQAKAELEAFKQRKQVTAGVPW